MPNPPINLTNEQNKPMTLDHILAQAVFYSDDRDYHIIKLPARAITVAASIIAEVGDPFAALIVDKDEVTLLLAAEMVEEFTERLQRLPGYTLHPAAYRLITVDIELDFDLIGLMAALSAALAGAGVSILAFAAYSRDHIFVPAAQFDTALAALNTLKDQS